MAQYIKGLKELQAKIDKLHGKLLKSQLEQTTKEAALYVLGTVPPYPPEPIGSTYKRSGTLGRLITTDVRTVGADVVGIIGSPTPYSPWVISSEEVPAGTGPQSRVHKGRWYTLQSVVANAAEEVVKFFDKMIKNIVDKD